MRDGTANDPSGWRSGELHTDRSGTHEEKSGNSDLHEHSNAKASILKFHGFDVAIIVSLFVRAILSCCV